VPKADRHDLDDLTFAVTVMEAEAASQIAGFFLSSDRLVGVDFGRHGT
jgi:hypothetical protein